ncbi:hypothetical protein LTR66_001600 [Elasticomyces elasticus]|nr:hypothetical protein LTR50_005160 [Elasticomyces elasticus]KAK4999354.1 hypothetical protein LTR66_001600 [Elasticomyces elasticus]
MRRRKTGEYASLSDTLEQLFHAYVFGCAFWYAVRATARLWDPAMVVGWFRPPVDAAGVLSSVTPNDLELYTIWTDGWGLMTLAAMLLIISGAVPLSASSSSNDAARVMKPYAKAAIAATIFHHLLTGYGAYQHFSKPTHYNNAMAVGVYGSGGLAILGALVLMMGIDTAEKTPRLRKTA